ncbi:MAG: class I SAM-dependent methyltransferase [Anaerolineaceae bacterium]|nr:class I SAM-dependent methyltransferase [Anaerolineaceae bacterium]
MPLNWMDVSTLDFNTLLLLERIQISWLPMFKLPDAEFAAALRANPVVEWYLRHKCPEINTWLDQILVQNSKAGVDVRLAEIEVLKGLEDLLVYVHDPAIYDAQPFLNWDSGELISLVDFHGKIVLDIGAGTGRLTFLAAEAKAVFPVEPVANLRLYIKQKAKERSLENIFPADGLITDIPFPDGFADVTMGGHVFGDAPEAEYQEMLRVTRPGGLIIFCPGNNDADNDRHHFLVSEGFFWGSFEEPRDGMKRKYWRMV